jgi:hypothetical protein
MSNSSSLFPSNTKSRPVSQSPSKEVILQMELHIFIFTVEVQRESMLIKLSHHITQIPHKNKRMFLNKLCSV